MAAPTALNKKAEDWDEFKPSKRFSAMRAMRAPADHARIKEKMFAVVAERNDVQKTTDDDAEEKEEKNDHVSILSRNCTFHIPKSIDMEK